MDNSSPVEITLPYISPVSICLLNLKFAKFKEFYLISLLLELSGRYQNTAIGYVYTQARSLCLNQT